MFLVRTGEKLTTVVNISIEKKIKCKGRKGGDLNISIVIEPEDKL